LRTSKRNYHICIGDRVTFQAQAILPLYQISGILDEVMSATSARIGAVVCLDKDARTAFEVITKHNIAIPQWIQDKYHHLRLGVRPQMTWRLLAEQIRLRESGTHLMYLSGLLAELRLVELWEAERLYSATCDCGNVVFSNTLLAACQSCAEEPVLELRPNAQIIGRISDETAALQQNHNLLVADHVWQELVGGFPTAIDKSWLQERERRLAYVRLTWVLMWLGGWSGGRLVLVDVLE
jgi:hypothetical protein